VVKYVPLATSCLGGALLLPTALQSPPQHETAHTLYLLFCLLTAVFMAVFSKCADTLQEGKRLENLSWRIYSRETFCCSPANRSPASSLRRNSSDHSLPDLSCSFESRSSVGSDMGTPEATDLASRFSSLSTSESGRKHITPIDLENIVKSVTESKELAPLSPLPRSLCTVPEHLQSHPKPESQVSDPTPPAKTHTSSPLKLAAESSTSTMATAGSQGSQLTLGDSTATEISGTSIVHGFSKENVSRSRISRTQLAPPQPILKPSPKPISPITAPMNAPTLRKKPIAFMLGGSEGDESSPESLGSRSFLAEGLRSSRKMTSFKDEVLTIQDRMVQAEEAIDDSEDEPSESAIEDDDDWEDEPEPPSHQQPQNPELFKRVDSSTNLSSRRSLLTTMMHETDRKAALQNAASRSTPAIRRRTSSHNGPLGSSPPSGDHVQLSRARPINVSTSQTAEIGQLPPSPRTNRRNMLSVELTGSLRKHLLWERQNRNPASKALKNRTFKSETRLSDRLPGPYLGNNDIRRNESLNFYDNGLQEYYEKGW